MGDSRRSRYYFEAAIAETEEAIKGDDAAAMEDATTKLTEATGGVAHLQPVDKSDLLGRRWRGRLDLQGEVAPW